MSSVRYQCLAALPPAARHCGVVGLGEQTAEGPLCRMKVSSMNERNQKTWPDIPYSPWRSTCSALHLYSQIIGKYRLARTPWVNHSWHATLYPSARGFTRARSGWTGGIELSLDLIDHQLVGTATNGLTARFPLQPMSVATFHAGVLDLVGKLGGTPEFDGKPNEIPDAIPFAEDRAERPYDADAVNRFFRASVVVTTVLQTFRTAYLGKVSPVHLFWGSFDLAVLLARSPICANANSWTLSGPTNYCGIYPGGISRCGKCSCSR